MKLTLLGQLIGALSLAACSSMPFPGVHEIEIQQGNVITQEMVNKLAPDMSKREVQKVLGSSPLHDVFHRNRWDYIYSYRSGEQRQQRRLTLFFEDDKLIRIAGDIQASREPSANGAGP